MSTAIAMNEETGEVIQASSVPSVGALEAITRGEVDLQVSTAKRFPRSLTKFKQDALAMATLDVETAEACFYVLRRGGNTIEGPGVRLAEIVASCWGNLRCEARIVDEDGRFITAQGTAWDMERNVLVRVETRRRITDRNGKTYADDMIGVTGNAASAIAFRNAVFKVIPNAFTRAIYEAARRTAVGDDRTLAQRRQMALTWFNKAGVSEARVLAMLGKQGIDDIDVACIGILAGTRTAIQEGTTTIDEAFPPEPLKQGTHGFGFKKDQPAAETAKAEEKKTDDDDIASAEARWAKDKAEAQSHKPELTASFDPDEIAHMRAEEEAAKAVRLEEKKRKEAEFIARGKKAKAERQPGED